MKILIIGKNGQLGQSIAKLVGQINTDEFVFTHSKALNLSNPSNIADYFASHSFDVIVNCTAFTAVDKAQTESEQTYKINCDAVKQIATIAHHNHSKLIHISSDYVFDGNSCQPYYPHSKTAPLNVYGQSKLLGEQAIQLIMPNNAAIIRTSWLYSEFGHNFVRTMLSLAKQQTPLNIITDQIGTPTYASDLAAAIIKIINHPHFKQVHTTQIYHYANIGVASWYDFAKAIFELSHIDYPVQPISTKDYPLPATRPKITVMNSDKISQTFNLKIPYWRESLKICTELLATND